MMTKRPVDELREAMEAHGEAIPMIDENVATLMDVSYEYTEGDINLEQALYKLKGVMDTEAAFDYLTSLSRDNVIQLAK